MEWEPELRSSLNARGIELVNFERLALWWRFELQKDGKYCAVRIHSPNMDKGTIPFVLHRADQVF